MRIRGLGAAKRAGLWARSFVRPGPIILGYHQVAESAWDPQHLCVSPDNFSAQIEVLLERAKPLSLKELLDGSNEDTSSQKAFVVTLDDGYTDSLEVAAPILEKHGVPATVFVTTGMIGKPFWWCEVQHFVERSAALPERISVDVDERRFRWSRKSDNEKARAHLVQSLGDLFRVLPFDRHEDALQEIRKAFVGMENEGSGIRAMTAEEVVALSNIDGIVVGSHMVTHTSLNQLDDAAQRIELEESKSTLEAITGKPVDTFSYPNGRLNKVSPSLARAAGYTAGCTSRQELAARNCDPMLLPRIWAGDWDAEQFSRWLWRWRL
jgi:peptidoglycan/xylan/chitin deacetylase (PgdA/CDA1 family)